MDDLEFADAENRLKALDVRVEVLRARLESCWGVPPGMYVFVLEFEDVEFLIDPRRLWGPPRVLVRRGGQTVEVWLREDDVALSSRRARGMSRFEERRVLGMVGEHFDDLYSAWLRIREDARRGQLERNPLVD